MKKLRRPMRLPEAPPRQFTRARLGRRYVTLLEIEGAKAHVAFPNGLKATVPKADLEEIETFTLFGSGG